MWNKIWKTLSFKSKQDDNYLISNNIGDDKTISIDLFYQYYISIPVINKCINLIAHGVSNIEVLHAPDNWKVFISNAIRYYLITGNIFIVRQNEEFILLDPKHVRIEKTHYECLNVKYYNVLHIKMFNPYNSLIGLSPLYNIKKEISIIEKLRDMLLHSMGYGPYIFTIDNNSGTEPDKNNLRQALYNFVSDLTKGKNPCLVVYHNIDIKSMQKFSNWRETKEIYDHISGVVVGAFGLSPAAIGELMPTYNNLKITLEDRDNQIFVGYITQIITAMNKHFNLQISLQLSFAP